MHISKDRETAHSCIAGGPYIGWTLEILKVIFDVPTLGLVTLPEFEDEPPAGIPTPVAVSPLVVLTDEQIAAMFNTPTALPTPRRLMF